MKWVRSQIRGVPAHSLIWTLVACSATFSLLQGLRNRNRNTEQTSHTHKAAISGSDQTQHGSNGSSDHQETDEEQVVEEEEDGEISGDEVEEKNICEGSEEDEEEQMMGKDEIPDESF